MAYLTAWQLIKKAFLSSFIYCIFQEVTHSIHKMTWGEFHPLLLPWNHFSQELTASLLVPLSCCRAVFRKGESLIFFFPQEPVMMLQWPSPSHAPHPASLAAGGRWGEPLAESALGRGSAASPRDNHPDWRPPTKDGNSYSWFHFGFTQILGILKMRADVPETISQNSDFCWVNTTV